MDFSPVFIIGGAVVLGLVFWPQIGATIDFEKLLDVTEVIGGVITLSVFVPIVYGAIKILAR